MIAAVTGAWMAVAFVHAIGMPDHVVWVFVGMAVKPTGDFVQHAATVFWQWARA